MTVNDLELWILKKEAVVFVLGNMGLDMAVDPQVNLFQFRVTEPGQQGF